MNPAASNNAVEAVDDFVPHCSECRYDLSGLPDGVCPECGKSFTHWALRHPSEKPSPLVGIGIAAGAGIASLFMSSPLMVFVASVERPAFVYDWVVLYFGLVGLCMMRERAWSAGVLSLYGVFACLLPVRLMLGRHDLGAVFVSIACHLLLTVPVAKYRPEMGRFARTWIGLAPAVCVGLPMMMLDPARQHWTEYLHPVRTKPDCLTVQEAHTTGLVVVILCTVFLAVRFVLEYRRFRASQSGPRVADTPTM